MNLEFARLMAQATRLTREGDLPGATVAIKAALASAKAQVVQASHPSGRSGAQADVIEVTAREVPASRDADAEAPTSDLGEFLACTLADASGDLRAYKLFVPPQAGRPGAGPLPLLVMLHGCTQNPDDFAAGTRMNLLAQQRGWFVLYPTQTHEANASRCWNWFMPAHQQRQAGEPALIAAMTRAVMQRHGVDPRRVYVAGLSAGGAMAALLGRTWPELYAGVGVHSGLPAGAASDLKSALVAMRQGALMSQDLAGSAELTGAPDDNTALRPTLAIHGDQDSTVNPLNGEHVVAALARGAVLQTERDLIQGRTCTRRIWRDPSGRLRAEHWTVHGAGHAWSGGSTQGSYTDASGPDASALMLDFFTTLAREAG